jgi:glycosyltransferase involved in cell wall biosynthesis
MPSENNPLVSVIIPVYNGTNYLREAIESVLAQTYTNYEILVVDDGSTDATWDIIQSYGARVRGIHKENGGVASALNRGIREAKGDYIAWLSHDDIWLPRKLESQVAFVCQFPQLQGCYTNFVYIDGECRILSTIESPWYPRNQAIRAMLKKVYIHGCTVLIARSCFERIGLFEEELRYTQDADMWLRLLREFEIGHKPDKLVHVRFHSEQGSRNRAKHKTEKQKMYRQIFVKLGMEAIFPEQAGLSNNPHVIAGMHRWLGDTMAFSHGLFALADEQYRQSVTVWPSWRNPARLRRIANSILHHVSFLYLPARRVFRQAIRVKPQL